jgi:hypothetical protein
MGPRITRQAAAPPSTGHGDEDAEGAADATTGAEGAADTVAVTDPRAAAEPEAGALAEELAVVAVPGDPLQAVKTAKTSHRAARTPLFYYAGCCGGTGISARPPQLFRCA